MALHFFKNLLSLKPSREIPLKKNKNKKQTKNETFQQQKLDWKKKEFKDEINFWWRNTKKKSVPVDRRGRRGSVNRPLRRLHKGQLMPSSSLIALKQSQRTKKKKETKRTRGETPFCLWGRHFSFFFFAFFCLLGSKFRKNPKKMSFQSFFLLCCFQIAKIIKRW